MTISKLLKTGALIAFAAAIFLAYTNAQNIEDWFRLRGYTPPAAIASFAKEDSMTLEAMRIFYVTHPVLETSLQKFQQACANAEQTIVLGCYISGRSIDNNIIIREINDDRLEGVEQVTAAHEMLHSAYDRLGPKEKQEIDAILLNYYKNDLTDQRIKDTIESYKKTEPTELINEMHSIFGTEIRVLPAALESYYKRYFIDRSKVTSLAMKYETEFSSRKSQVEVLDQRLNSLKDQIISAERDLNQRGTELQSQRNRIENSGSQAEVDTYNLKVNQYNDLVRQYQRLITTYNILVEERNLISKELDSLRQSLDSRISTQPNR
jgi:hypothetical protein